MVQTFEDYARYYSSLSDEDLQRLSQDVGSLVQDARRALKGEMVRRHIDVSTVAWAAIPQLTGSSSSSWAGGGAGCLFTLWVVGAGIWWVATTGYDGLDAQGYIPHTVDSTIVVKDNWLTGESKDCFSLPLDADTARALSKPVGYVLSQVTCDDDGNPHGIKIRFFGMKVQTGLKGVGWRCALGRVTASHAKKLGQCAESDNPSFKCYVFTLCHNFARIHKTMRIAPRLVAGVSDRV
jgi:hypothetical protein